MIFLEVHEFKIILQLLKQRKIIPKNYSKKAGNYNTMC